MSGKRQTTTTMTKSKRDMIALEFTGQLSDNARTQQEDGKLVLVFPVTNRREVKQKDGTYKTVTTEIHCRKVGAFKVDSLFRKGLRVYIRGDVSAAVDGQGTARLSCTVWQFELL